MSKHAPGPWKLLIADGKVAILDDNTRLVCEVFDEIPVDWANVRLIREAPELLEAAFWLVQKINESPYSQTYEVAKTRERLEDVIYVIKGERSW